MKKLLFSLLCAMSVLAVKAQTITIQGVLATEPCVEEEYQLPHLSTLAIATTEKTYIIKDKCGENYIETTLNGVEGLLWEGDKVVATGTVTTHVNDNGSEYYMIDVISINEINKVDWCTQWNVIEFRFDGGVGPDISEAKTYTFVADGDTVIADNTYTKIMRYWSFEPENTEYIAAIRHQNDSVMVYYEDEEYLLYDFGVQVGDEREIFAGLNNVHYAKTFKNKVTDLSILPDGRRKILIDIYERRTNGDGEYIKDHEKDWTEGIGCTWHGLLYTGGIGLPGACGNALLCAYKETDCVYTAEIDWLNELGCVYNYNRYADTIAQAYEGHAYVDLELTSGTLWATYNVGATAPEQYGDYFAWGETTSKSYYSWLGAPNAPNTYKWGEHSYSAYPDYGMTKYNKTDGKTVLDAADDAATANWGGAWCMPTMEEQKELIDECTWSWTTLNGVYGYRVTSKKDYTKSIFLPSAGFYEGSNLKSAGEYGGYWSSSLGPTRPTEAYSLYFESDYHDCFYGDRYYGSSVRPVVSKESTSVENIEHTNFDNIRKVIENGQVVIIRDGVRYNVLGVRL